MEDELGKLRQEKDNIDAAKENNDESEADDDRITELKDRIRELEASGNNLTSEIAALSGKIEDAWEELRHGLTEVYKEPLEKAVKAIDKITETGRKAEELLSGIEAFLDGNFAGDSEFVKTLREDIAKIKGLLLKGQKAAEMVRALDANAQILNQLTEKLDLLKDQPADGSSGSLADSILELALSYNNHLEYEYEKPEKGSKAEDPRKDKVRELKDTLLEKVFDDKNFTGGGINPDQLPSSQKVVSRSFDEEDAPYLGQAQAGASEEYTGKSAGYEGDLGSIAEEADLYDEEGMFQENALGFTGSIGSLLEGNLTELRDNIYINEYIMGMFKNHVPSVKKPGNSGNATFTFLNGVERDVKETFFECEVEYILHGDSSEITNRALTCAQILLFRLGANTLHVYTDAKKRQLAVTTATAVAGWWTGGAGIPVISNLIMCAWGMGEAIIDLRLLTSGEAVPIYKSPGDWKLDIGLPKAGGVKTDARLYFSYHDYLRLFLLTMDENKKLGRTEDLIEVNIGLKKPGFKASGCNTFIRVEAEISIKNLFISQPLIPEGIRMENGRRKIRVLVYEGY